MNLSPKIVYKYVYTNGKDFYCYEHLKEETSNLGDWYVFSEVSSDIICQKCLERMNDEVQSND